MIQPGLARIGRLLKNSHLPWRAIHVAGTNGKGSVCAFASAMLHAANIRCGRFTSPHLIDRWDCITIDEKIVDESMFQMIEDGIKRRNQNESICASEFELLTATAFEIFTRENIEIGIIEAGLGGRQDATNIIEDPLVTVITKIGRDHEAFLGDSLEEIADHKAGIMKSGVACIVDATNSNDVHDVLRANAKVVGAGPLLPVTSALEADYDMSLKEVLTKSDLERHQQINMSLAFHAVSEALRRARLTREVSSLLAGLENTVWEGRLQLLSIRSLTGRKEPIVLDGAHNAQSAEALASFVDRRIRSLSDPVTWIIAVSAGKEVSDILTPLLRDGDNLVAVEFGPVDGMPWVSPTDSISILATAQRLHQLSSIRDCGRDIRQAVQVSVGISQEGPLIIAGSLYLVSDVLRLLRFHR